MHLRSEKEKQSVDSSNIYQNSEKLPQNFAHVFECPNTLRYEKQLLETIGSLVPGKRVLDIDCGPGDSSKKLLKGIFIINK